MKQSQNKSPLGKQIIVLISADSEWQAVKQILVPGTTCASPFGEYFLTSGAQRLTYFHGGWGKISAAATTQYVIDHFQPDLIINLGTCGGFAGRIASGTVILVTKTIVYDIIEQMTDPEAAIAHYSTFLDTTGMCDDSKLPVQSGLLISADRDILANEIPELVEKYGAVAADWESGAIAWVAQKNRIKCIILRGVSDTVSIEGGEAYGNIDLFHERTKVIMENLIKQLPAWL